MHVRELINVVRDVLRTMWVTQTGYVLSLFYSALWQPFKLSFGGSDDRHTVSSRVLPLTAGTTPPRLVRKHNSTLKTYPGGDPPLSELTEEAMTISQMITDKKKNILVSFVRGSRPKG